MQDKDSNIPYAPQYVDLVIDQSKSIEDQQQGILSQAQGEFVLINDNTSLPNLLKIVHLLRSVAEEVVFKTKSDQLVCLFSNNTDTLLRNKNINTSFIFESLDLTKSSHSQIINLDTIWEKQPSQTEDQKLSSSLSNFKNIFSNPLSLTLVGNLSTVFFY